MLGVPTPRADPQPALTHSLSAWAARGPATAGSSGAPTATTLPRSYTVPTRRTVDPVPGSASGGCRSGMQVCRSTCTCSSYYIQEPTCLHAGL